MEGPLLQGQEAPVFKDPHEPPADHTFEQLAHDVGQTNRAVTISHLWISFWFQHWDDEAVLPLRWGNNFNQETI